MKESYESMKLLLGKVKYGEFKWKLCGDLKVVARLLGMQLGTAYNTQHTTHNTQPSCTVKEQDTHDVPMKQDVYSQVASVCEY